MANPQCNVKLDRDISASKNILAQVQRQLNLKDGKTLCEQCHQKEDKYRAKFFKLVTT